jgi:hypothetical protein
MWDMLQYFTEEMVDAGFIGGTGTYVKGEWVSTWAASVPIVIIAPQPLKANELDMLEDGERRSDYLTSWSETRVYPREAQQNSDRIVWDGDTYKVVQADNRATLGDFYRFVMRRLEPNA